MGGVYNPFNLNLYAYSHQNPVKYVDPDGKYVETAWDVTNVVMGIDSFFKNVKEGNYLSALVDLGGLTYDTIATLAPVLPAFAGVAIKLSRSSAKAFKHASEYGIQSYSKLRKAIKGKGLQAHHIIEKRFAEKLGLNQKEMSAVALTKKEHQKFTNAWRKRLQYGEKYTKQQVMEAAKKIYKDHPEMLKAAIKDLKKAKE